MSTKLSAQHSGLLLATFLAACAGPRPNAHVPPFARVPYQALSRQAVVAIALREWRAFGQPVDDRLPGAEAPAQQPVVKPEREEGLWQRVGEYWWLGMDAGSRDSRWTGKHDAHGNVFPASEDGDYAWSAAFVSYVVRMAGAGPGFPYSATHSDYIHAALRRARGETDKWVITAERPEAYAPEPGDLICHGRGATASLHFDEIPSSRFPAHCDIVVDIALPGQIAAIGGNFDDAVTLTHVPVTANGRVAAPDGTSLDPRYTWMVVLRLLLPPPPAVPVAAASDQR